MTTPFDTDDQWSRCPIGYLQRYARVEKRRLWLRLAGRAAAIVALLAVTASSAVYSFRSISPSQRATITAPGCQEIARLLDDFKAGKLSPEESLKVRQHLEHCDHCRRLVDPDAVGAAGPHCCPKPPETHVTGH